jgi:hypothetical protein
VRKIKSTPFILMTRTGKIARLPQPIRDQVNLAFRNGVPAVILMRWLNSQPEVQLILAQYFGGRPINQPNLTEWKQGGYRDWLMREELFEHALASREAQQQAKGASNSTPPEPAVADSSILSPLENWTKLNQMDEPKTDRTD